MCKTLVFAASLWLLASPASLQAQTPAPPATNKPSDSQEPNRFWQASISDGHYMVAIDRISAISRHKYLLDGAIIVDEVTVDALGQALVRFYFLSPLTDATTGNAAGKVASHLAERARDLVDKSASDAGTDVHNMVVKKFPETTHAHEIEFRILSVEALNGLYASVRAAWETGHGRKFTIK